MALKHVQYHIRSELPVQVQCMIQDAWGWCTGMTQRDGTEREVRWGGVQDGEHVYTCGRFMLMYEITSSIFSDHKTFKLEINYQKRAIKKTKMWWLNYILLNNQWITGEIKEEKKTIPRDKWKQKHNGPKPMGCSKSSSKREFYSNTILHQEIRKTLNRQPNFTPKITGKRRTKLPQIT